MKTILLSVFLTLSLTLFVNAQKTENGNKKQGVVFKIPDGVFPIDWKKSDFKGLLMLRQDSPSGLFVCYPNDNESIENLKGRVAKYVAPMFIHNEKEKESVSFQIASIPNHKNDFGESAQYYSYANESSMIQILFYERIANETKFTYGYFAMKDKDANTKKDWWADDKGQGVKIFENFWKTFKD